MISIDKISHWSVAHNPKWLAFVRVALGLTLIAKGLSFLYHPLSFHDLVTSSLNINAGWVDYTIIWINIIAGFFILMGFLTRLASAIQIPLLLGAVFFVNAGSSTFAFQNSLLLSVLILILLAVFFVEGDGPISLTGYVKNEDDSR
ncbi:MAG TPA: DoxX family protein [Ferruginibacter sp.]|jgi:putative oxidoreductase|nr:DoxX family protein [Ferruginibacter sp.]